MHQSTPFYIGGRERLSAVRIPPHFRTQVKSPGGCPGETTPPSVTTPLVTTAFVRVTPRPEGQLEADESIYALTYVYGDGGVKVWSAYAEDEEKLERDDIARNRIMWERLNPSADWFLCYENGKRIEDGGTVSHGDRVLIRHRDEADPGRWHRAMSEATMKVTPPVTLDRRRRRRRLRRKRHQPSRSRLARPSVDSQESLCGNEIDIGFVERPDEAEISGQEALGNSEEGLLVASQRYP
jgi:hypothetical protein